MHLRTSYMHPSQNRNFDPRISIFHLDLSPNLTDYSGKSIPFHTLLLTGLLATGSYYTQKEYRVTNHSGYLFTGLSCRLRK